MVMRDTILVHLNVVGPYQTYFHSIIHNKYSDLGVCVCVCGQASNSIDQSKLWIMEL